MEFFAGAAGDFLYHLVITVADEALDEFVGECAVKVELVPVLLIHVPGTCYFGVSVAQFYGVVGLAFEHEPLRALQVEHRKDASPDAKGKGGFIEGEVLGGEREGEAIFSDRFDVHKESKVYGQESRDRGIGIWRGGRKS